MPGHFETELPGHFSRKFQVNAIKNAIESPWVFDPTPDAVTQWEGYKSYYKTLGQRIPDDVIEGSLMYIENNRWIKEVLASGCDVIDILSDGTGISLSYEMEKRAIYGQ